ncbi:MAG: response regulator of citrate/malate metabolism, partial [Bacteriovoracaceae bacterium]
MLPSRQKYSVLVVDDEEYICQMMKTMLSSFPSIETIITCNTSQLAIQKLHNQEFDVIILDNHMPNRLGLELIKIIVNFKNVKAKQIIFMSGMMEDTEVVTAIKMGVKHFLIKP